MLQRTFRHTSDLIMFLKGIPFSCFYSIQTLPVHQITSATVVTTVLPVLPLLVNFYHYFVSPTIQQFYQ